MVAILSPKRCFKKCIANFSQPNPLLCFFKHLPGPLVTRIILGIFQIWRVQLSRWKLSLCHNTGWPLVGNVGMKLYMVLMGDENSLIPHKGPAFVKKKLISLFKEKSQKKRGLVILCQFYHATRHFPIWGYTTYRIY